MRHIKTYKIFESVEDDLLEIKELFQEVADEWDFEYRPSGEIFQMVNDVLNDDSLSGGGYYSVVEGAEESRHIVIQLPHGKITSNRVTIDMDKFNKDVDKFIDNVKVLGYKVCKISPGNGVMYLISFRH